jgi:pyruvate,water dikinase
LNTGYDTNRRAMLEMMGADAVSTSIPGPPQRSRWQQLQMLVRMGGVFSRRHRLVADFTASIETVLRPLESTAWRDVDADDVVALWHDVRHRLLRGWQAPLLADFLAMVTHSTLRRFCARHGISDVDVAELFSGEQLAGVAPTRALADLAQRIRVSSMRDVFGAALSADALALLRDDDELGPMFSRFFAAFGARAMHELKLEQPTWNDDPTFVVRQLQDLVRSAEVPIVVDGPARVDAAEARLRAQLSVFARPVFRALVNAARTWMGHRERMRYARARTFAVLRSLALRLGDVLVQADTLDDRRDVFFLEHDELTGVFDGTATTHDLRGLVALRRREDAQSQQKSPPDRAAYAHGVILGPPLVTSPPLPPSPADGVLHGIAVMGGVATGPVRLVLRRRRPRRRRPRAGVSAHRSRFCGAVPCCARAGG